MLSRAIGLAYRGNPGPDTFSNHTMTTTHYDLRAAARFYSQQDLDARKGIAVQCDQLLAAASTRCSGATGRGRVKQAALSAYLRMRTGHAR